MPNMIHQSMPYNNMKMPPHQNINFIANNMQINNQFIRENKDSIDNGINDDKSEGVPEDESINNISSIMPLEDDANISELNYD